MAEILCCSCSSTTCDGLLTVGYMGDMIPSTHCSSLTADGTPYNGCCGEISGSSLAVNYAQASSGTYAALRHTNNSNPNDDTSGFVFNVAQRTAESECCQPLTSNTILKRSEAFFDYTVAKDNRFTAVTEPKLCDLSYRADELKSYDRHRVYCYNGEITNTASSISVTDVHTENTDGSITKNYTQIQDQTRGWTVSFTPSAKTITGLTIDDCGGRSGDSITWNFPEYVVGYNRIGEFRTDFNNGNRPKVPCPGKVYEFVYSANTRCENDFAISYEILSEGQSISTDDTIEVNTSSATTYIGIDESSARTAEIKVVNVTITIGQNTNSKNNGLIKIGVSSDSVSYEDVYEFDRELCAWTAGDVSNPEGCSGYWPTIVDWTNPPQAGVPQDVIQVGPNINNIR